MAVEVNFWPPTWGGNIGHASILVEGYGPSGAVYLSVWPKDLSMIWGGGALQSYKDDIDSEGGTPYKVRMSKLDEASIRRKIAEYQKQPHYAFLTFNCAVQASLCLHAGVSSWRMALDGVLGSTSMAVLKHSPNFTPWGLYLSAKALAMDYT